MQIKELLSNTVLIKDNNRVRSLNFIETIVDYFDIKIILTDKIIEFQNNSTIIVFDNINMFKLMFPFEKLFRNTINNQNKILTPPPY